MSKSNNFICPVSDTTFKYMIKNDACKSWWYKLIYQLTNINLDQYSLYDPELNSGNDKKDYRCDTMFTKDIGDLKYADIVNIEMYKDKKDHNEVKSLCYICRIYSTSYTSGEEYSKDRNCVQINFHDYNSPHDKANLIENFGFVDIARNITKEGIVVYDIYIASCAGICYNESEKNELEASLALLHCNSYEEMRKVANGNKELLKMADYIEDLEMDEKFIGVYDANKEHERELNTVAKAEFSKGEKSGFDKGEKSGFDKGERNKSIEIAKYMLKENEPIVKISKFTGLSTNIIRSLEV